MKENKLLIIFTLLLLSSFFSLDSFAQAWKRNRKEWIFGIGATGFLGDLGGANAYGTDYSPIDMELTLTRPVLSVGMKYQISNWSKLRGNFAFGQVAGDDKLTKEKFRNNRNLHFKSPIAELSFLYEFYFQRERVGLKYNIRQSKGFKWKNFASYGFTGFATIFFNPRAQYNGQWYALQPLGTEGQGMIGFPKKYSRINFAIPVGVGVQYSLNRLWKVGMEFGYRKTFTDYIDDVSGHYADHSTLAKFYEENGIRPDLANIADPNLKSSITTGYDESGLYFQGITADTKDVLPYPLRGQPQKDAYLFASFTVIYKIISFGSRAKF